MSGVNRRTAWTVSEQRDALCRYSSRSAVGAVTNIAQPGGVAITRVAVCPHPLGSD